MSHLHSRLAVASFLAAIALSSSARADVPPPDTLSCRTASEGDSCDPDDQAKIDGGLKRGTCRKATCSRLDYGNWNRDASATPPTMSYECLKCLLGNDGGADFAPPADAAVPATGGSGGQSGAGGSGGAATGGASGSSGADDGSGCSLGRFPGPRALGPWALAGGFAAAVWFGRRRRR